ncbi:hypothetical protein [Rathayibacter soli]|uniref:hypothetical protein n=1 Tax=Rathayibacter soli TaxID=3144168 RepID=UPI0027E3F00D|nr:hypothetical protein [Glaciibacter superstes]
MKTQQNRAATAAPHQARAGAHVDESVLRALEADSRLLVAFPWARTLSREERAEFADQLAHHPTEMTNSAIEELLVTWHARADAARTRHVTGLETRRAA